MEDYVDDTSQWAWDPPGAAISRSSKRHSTISLEDPCSAVQEHYALYSQYRRDHRSPPAPHHDKPALGLLLPQEVYHYDPSPAPSPDVHCPLQPSVPSPAPPYLAHHSPLEDYLNNHDQGERRMLGLWSSSNPPDQLPPPLRDDHHATWLETSSTVDPSWDMVESPNAVGQSPGQEESLHAAPASVRTSSWEVVPSPNGKGPALSPSQGSDISITQPRSADEFHPHEGQSLIDHRPQLNKLLAQASIEVDPVVVGESEAFEFDKEAYPWVGCLRSNRASPINGTSRPRSMRKHKVRKLRERMKKESSAETGQR